MKQLLLVLSVLALSFSAHAAEELVFANAIENATPSIMIAAVDVPNVAAADAPGAIIDTESLLKLPNDEKTEATAEAAIIIKEAPKAENEIPVKLDAKVSEKTAGSSLTQMLLTCAVIAGFVGIAYLLLNKYRHKNAATSQFQMKILAQHHLGPKKSLAVIRVAGESILIGITDHHVSMIKSLALIDDEIPEVTGADFSSYVKNAAPDTEPVFPKESSKSRFERPNSDEEFTISKIRDVVSRQVRNLKSLE